MHLLAGSEVQIEKGLEFTQEYYPLPELFKYSESLLHQIGKALLDEDFDSMGDLRRDCEIIQKQAQKHVNKAIYNEGTI